MTEFIDYKTHSVLINMKETVRDTLEAISEYDISVCGIRFVKRQECIHMILAVILITRNQFA